MKSFALLLLSFVYLFASATPDSSCVNVEEKLYVQYLTGNSSIKNTTSLLSSCNMTKLESSFKEAKFLFRIGEFSQSKEMFIELLPDLSGYEKANAFYYLGQIDQKNKEYYSAINYYKKSSNKNFFAHSVNFNIAECYYELEDYTSSNLYYNMVLELNKKNTAAWNNLALNMENLGDYETSLAFYLVADSIAKGSKVLYQSNIVNIYRLLKNYKEGLAFAEKAYSRYPDSPQLIDKYAYLLGDSDQFPKAISVIRAFLTKNEGTTDVYFRIGYSYDKLGAIDSSLYYYYKNISKANDQYGTLHNIAYLYRIIGRFDLSIKYMNASLAVKPDYEHALDGIGNVYIWMHEYEKSHETVLNFERHFPNSDRVFLKKGYSLLLLKRYEEAIPYFYKKIEVLPNDSRAYNNLGRCYAKMGDFEKATHCFSEALIRDSTNSFVYHNRASMYYDLGKFQMACADLSRAIQEEYNWVIDSTLYDLVESHCPTINLNRKINFHGYKGNLSDMKDRSFIELIEKSEKDYSLLDSTHLDYSEYDKERTLHRPNSDNNSYNVWPNPTKGLIKVKFEEPIEFIKVFDSKGGEVMNINLQGKQNAEFDLSDQVKGIYILIASDKKEVKFIERLVLN